MNVRFAEHSDKGPLYLQFDVWVTDKEDWEQTLTATAFNYVLEKSADQRDIKSWEIKTDFDLIKGQCGISILTSIRPGSADYPYIMLPKLSNGEALLA